MRYAWLRWAVVGMALLLAGAGCITIGGTASGLAGVFRSTDKGETWQPTVIFPTAQGVQSLAGVNVYRLFPDPSDPNSLYLATRGNGLFYSYNSGDTWQWAEALGNRFIYSVAVDPKDKCVIYVTDGAALYKTTDCSRSWRTVYTEVQPSDRIVAVALNPQNSQVVYTAKYSGDMLISSDGGASWRIGQRFGVELQDLAVTPLKPGRVYLATRTHGLYRSDDSGATWFDVSQGLAAFAGSTQFFRLVVHPKKPDSIFWISKYGILRSDDAGSSWADLKLIPAPGTVNIYAFGINSFNEKEIYYTASVLGSKGEHIRSTLYKTTDGGTRWVTRKLPTTTIPASMYLHPRKDGTLFLGFTSGA